MKPIGFISPQQKQHVHMFILIARIKMAARHVHREGNLNRIRMQSGRHAAGAFQDRSPEISGYTTTQQEVHSQQKVNTAIMTNICDWRMKGTSK